MSHFVVLVIRDPKISLEDQLQPFHEYECTGVEDEYVINMDITEDARKNYENSDKSNSFREFLQDYYGAQLEDPSKKQASFYKVDEQGEVTQLFDRTNPNKKWDWWVIGGRYSGRLKLKPGAKGDTGRPGLGTRSVPPGYADVALKRDIDFEGLAKEAEEGARAEWKKVREITKGETWETWESVRDRHSEQDIDKARDEYAAQPAIKALKATGDIDYTMFLDGDLSLDEEAYATICKNRSFSAFAFIRDGKWFEKGQMGWWGIVLNEKDKNEWQASFIKMVDELPDDTEFVMVDCHI